MRKYLSLLLAVAMLAALALPALAEEEANYDDQIMLISELEGEAVAVEDAETAEPVYAVEPDTDVPGPAPMWYDLAVEAVTGKGIMTGTGNGFEPDGIVTRATVFQTLYNLEGKPEIVDRRATFPDAQGKWYENAAHWAQTAGLTQGTGDGFQGEREIMRSELVVILNRYAQYKNADMTAGADVELLAIYADAELLTVWSVDAFKWAVGAGVISGKVDEAGTILAPGHTATRAELAQILVNFTDFFTPSVQ